MTKTFSMGTKFVLQISILLGIVLAFIPIIFSNYEVKPAQNCWVMRGIVLFFASISGLIAFFAFKPLRIKLSIETIVEIPLLLMLFSTVMTVSPSVFITAIFVISTICYAIIRKKINKPHPLFYFMGGYYVFMLIGLIWSIDLPHGLKCIDRGLLYIIIPLAFSCYIIAKDRRNLLLKIFFRCLFIFVLAGLIGYVFQTYYSKIDLFTGFGLHKGYLHNEMLTDYDAIFIWWGYGHPTFISFIITLMFGIGVYLQQSEPASESRISIAELFIYALCSMSLIIVLQSRLGMGLFPVGVFISVAWTLRKNRKLFFAIIGLSLSVIIVSIIYIYLSHGNYFIDPIRNTMYEASIKYIKEHPWLGTGTGGMRKQIVLDFINPHNQYYGEILHLGIIGAIVLWTMIGATIYYGIKNRNFPILYFMLLFFMLMFTEMPFSIHKGIILYTLFVCLFIRPNFDMNNSDSKLTNADYSIGKE